MIRFFEQYIPSAGFMDIRLDMAFGQHAQAELSRKTPVIDHLKGFKEFYDRLVEDILSHDVIDIFAIGKSGIGKGAIVEQTFRKIEDDRRLKGTRRGKNGVSKQYYSLAAQFQDAVAELGVVSPWGEFTPEELAEGAEKAAALGHEKLQQAEQTAPKPLIRGLDFIAVTPPVDLGSSYIQKAVARKKEDPRYTYRIVAVKTDAVVQEKTITMREALWELPEETESRDVVQVLRRAKVKPDTNNLDVTSVRTSAGHPRGLRMVNQLIHEQIVLRQDEIREKVDKGFPPLHSPFDVEKDAQSLDAAEDGYYRLLLFHDWGADPSHTLIVPNTFLDRQIPFYARRTSQYRIR